MGSNVSVIIPSFNHEKHLRAAVDSVLLQTLSDIEVLIIDDCSSDNSRRVISEIEDARVKTIFLDQNTGGCNVLNLGIEQSRSEFIAICNSDDVWLPDKLEKQVEVLRKNSDIGAVFSTVSIIDSKGNPLDADSKRAFDVFNQTNRSRGQWLRHLIEFGNCLCHPSILIRRRVYEQVGKYNDFYRQLPDYDMWLRLIQRFNIFLLQDPLVNFRVLEKGLNTSAPTKENLRRTTNEKRLILHSVFEEMTTETFQNAFGTLKSLSNPGFSLEVEKVLYLTSGKPNDARMRTNIAYDLLARFARNKKESWELMATYGISLKAIHSLAGLDSAWLDEEGGHSFAVSFPQSFEQAGQSFLPHRLARLRNHHNSLLHSFSWRITKVLRDAKQGLREKPGEAGSDGEYAVGIASTISSEVENTNSTTTTTTVLDPHEQQDELFGVINAISAIKESNSWRWTRSLRTLKLELESRLQHSKQSERTYSLPNPEIVIFPDSSCLKIADSAYEEIYSILESFSGYVYSNNDELENSIDKCYYGPKLSFNENLDSELKLAYCMSIEQASLQFPYFLENDIPFVFNFYDQLAGGQLEAAAREQLRRLCYSKLFRMLFVCHHDLKNYLIENQLCPSLKVSNLNSRPVPAFFETMARSERQLFPIHKPLLHIGFVIDADYAEDEIKAAVSLFELLLSANPNLRAFLIFDREIGDTPIQTKFQVDHEGVEHVVLSSAIDARNFFSTLDVMVCLNTGNSGIGKYSIFPHFDCIAAGLTGTAIFTTDRLKQNRVLSDETEILLLSDDAELDAAKIHRYLASPMLLQGLASTGRLQFRKSFGWTSQMSPRIELIKQVVG